MALRAKSNNLPPRMYKKTGPLAGGGEWVSYYHIVSHPITGKRTETALGSDEKEALIKYAKIEKANAQAVALMSHAFDRYVAEVLPTKSERSQKDARWILTKLRSVFNNAPMDSITPQVVAKYRDKRSEKAPVRANREMAFLSTVWNYAREWGFTEKENPCRGVRKNRERPRDFYADDETWNAVYQCANEELKNAMDLAYLTGQRPADVINFKFSDIHEDALELTQAKTTKKLRILLTTNGERNGLGKVIDRIYAQGVANISEYLVCSAKGAKLDTQTLRIRFNKAKSAAMVNAEPELAEKVARFQFRDIRPKAASELSIEHASALLGHSKEDITRKVYHRVGATVTPTR